MNAGFGSWLVGMSLGADALGGIASALAHTGTAYATTEESSTSALRSSGSGLNL